MYSKDDYDKFIHHMSKLDRYDACDIDRLKEFFIGIYSNPIDNKQR